MPWAAGARTVWWCADGLQAFALNSGRPVWPPTAALSGTVRLSVCRDGIIQTGLDDGHLTVRCLDWTDCPTDSAWPRVGMRGRYCLDARHRLVHMSQWGDGNWHPLPMFPLR